MADSCSTLFRLSLISNSFSSTVERGIKSDLERNAQLLSSLVEAEMVEEVVMSNIFRFEDVFNDEDFEDDEAFIGSYDDSHPHNRWDEGVERRGANAEDGMSTLDYHQSFLFLIGGHSIRKDDHLY